MFFDRLNEQLLKADIDEKSFLESKQQLEKAGAYDRREFEHLANLIATQDALGVLLRGHVLIEASIEDLLLGYFAHDVDLFGDLELFFKSKVNLARSLGLISEIEEKFLLQLNRTRNKLAHRTRGKGTPRFLLDAAEEKLLWQDFVASFGGNWPTYDAEKFPQFLKYICVCLKMRFDARASDLMPDKLTDKYDERSSIIGLLPGATVFLNRWAHRIIEEDVPGH